MTTQAVGGRSYEFGLTDRLRISRELAGFDQKAFAAATGISRSSIQNYESGATKPRRPQLIVWAMATGFSLRWLDTGQADDDGPDDDGGDEVRTRRDSNSQPSDWESQIAWLDEASQGEHDLANAA